MISNPDSTYDALAWGSHLPSLIAAISASSGNVLELGVGHFSTPAIHALCGQIKKKVVSVEDNSEWCDFFSKRYSSEFHEFINDSYDQIVPILSKRKWGVSFIDNSPGGERRKSDFLSLVNSSQFVVVHDFHMENSDAITPLLNGINFKICSEYMPPTLIASKSSQIPLSI